MNASDCFALTEIARTPVNGIDWVLYSDGLHIDATLASDYDDVPAEYMTVDVPRLVLTDDEDNSDAVYAAEHFNGNRYSRWCSRTATADRGIIARIIAEAGIEHVNSGAHGSVAAVEA